MQPFNFNHMRIEEGPFEDLPTALAKCGLRLWIFASTACGHRMAHRKWKESKQQPSMLPGPAVPGCCYISFHFLWAILCPQAVQISRSNCDENVLERPRPSKMFHVIINFIICTSLQDTSLIIFISDQIRGLARRVTAINYAVHIERTSFS